MRLVISILAALLTLSWVGKFGPVADAVGIVRNVGPVLADAQRIVGGSNALGR